MNDQKKTTKSGRSPRSLLQVFVKPEIYQRLQQEADQNGDTVSSIVRSMLRDRYNNPAQVPNAQPTNQTDK